MEAGRHPKQVVEAWRPASASDLCFFSLLVRCDLDRAPPHQQQPLQPLMGIVLLLQHF